MRSPDNYFLGNLTVTVLKLFLCRNNNLCIFSQEVSVPGCDIMKYVWYPCSSSLYSPYNGSIYESLVFDCI